MLLFEFSGCLGCALDDLLKEGPILRMNRLHNHVQGRLRAAVILEDAIGFVRPDNLSRIRIPPEAAGVTESLSFGQVGFAPLRLLGALYELFLCSLPVINIDT